MSEETSTPTSLPIPPPIPQTVTENSSTEEDKQETFTKTADVQQITLRKPSKVKELVKLNEQMLQKKKKSLVLPASVSGSLRPSRSRDFRFSFKKKSSTSFYSHSMFHFLSFFLSLFLFLPLLVSLTRNRHELSA